MSGTAQPDDAMTQSLCHGSGTAQPHNDPWEPTRRFFAALNELREGESLHIEGCYLPGDHEGDCRACAACDGDPEALGRHVCGREDFA